MNPVPSLTDEIFAAFLKCKYKAYLKLRGVIGERSEYEQLQTRLAAEYRIAARNNLLRVRGQAAVVLDPPSLRDAIRSNVSAHP